MVLTTSHVKLDLTCSLAISLGYAFTKRSSRFEFRETRPLAPSCKHTNLLRIRASTAWILSVYHVHLSLVTQMWTKLPSFQGAWTNLLQYFAWTVFLLVSYGKDKGQEPLRNHSTTKSLQMAPPSLSLLRKIIPLLVQPSVHWGLLYTEACDRCHDDVRKMCATPSVPQRSCCFQQGTWGMSAGRKRSEDGASGPSAFSWERTNKEC